MNNSKANFLSVFLPFVQLLDIPDRIIGRPTDHKTISILKAGNASSVTIQCPHKLARRRVPDLFVGEEEDINLWAQMERIDAGSFN